jgi:hypothetical protein
MRKGAGLRSGLGEKARGVRAKNALPDPVVGKAEPARKARLSLACDESYLVEASDIPWRGDDAEMLLPRATPLVVHAQDPEGPGAEAPQQVAILTDVPRRNQQDIRRECLDTCEERVAVGPSSVFDPGRHPKELAVVEWRIMPGGFVRHQQLDARPGRQLPKTGI